MTKNKSFTLIELLVVIVIIGILAGVIVISTSSSIDKANFAKTQAFSSTVQNELLPNLVHEWTFNETQVGGITKDTWGDKDGTVDSGATQTDTDCVYGKCYAFTGTSSINCGSLGPIGTDFTFSAWFKTSTVGVPIITVGTTDGNPELKLSSGKVQFNLRGKTGLTSTNTYNDNKWHFAIGGILNEKYFLYVDTLKSDPTASTTVGWTGNTLIGGGVISIDDVRIYDFALSFAQIEQEYIAGLDSLLSRNLISKEEYSQNVSNLSLE